MLEGTTYYFPPVRTQVYGLKSYSYSYVPNINFPLKPLCKILQGTRVTKKKKKIIGKCKCTLIKYSTVTIIAANKLIDVGANVQKHISH